MTPPAPRHDYGDDFFIRERRARSDAAKQIVRAITARHGAWEQSYGARRRRRRTSDLADHELMVEALICNAIHAHLRHSGRAVAISMGRQRPSRYSPPPYEPLGKLLSGLGQDGIGALQIVKGGRFDNSPGRLTTRSGL